MKRELSPRAKITIAIVSTALLLGIGYTFAQHRKEQARRELETAKQMDEKLKQGP